MSLAAGITAMLDVLRADMPDYSFDHGWSDEPADRRNRGFVWGGAIREGEDDTNVETVEIGIRLFPNYQQARGHPRDSSTFEDAAEALQAIMKDQQTTLPQTAGFWFLRLTEVVIDHELQRVDATVVMWGSNVFAQV